MRQGKVERNTKETRILVELDLDGTGKADISTGVGFLDHMLTLLAVHSFMDLKVRADADREVACQQTVEIALDFSGRPFLVWNADLIPRVTLGNFDTEMGEDFFRALAMNCGLTLHINVPYGKNTHHMLEAIFKGVARAMSQAVALDPRVHGVMSSKGAL